MSTLLRYTATVRSKNWTDSELKNAVTASHSIRSVIVKLGLVPAGGNYVQINTRIKQLKLSTKHFTGKGWKLNNHNPTVPAQRLSEILIRNSVYQSHKLKKRLIAEGLRSARCELCKWAERSEDGRIPIELDHINGDRTDNRLSNLRILCPNCHSLQPTHRGRNKGRTAHARVRKPFPGIVRTP